jgi:hypothetical protein
VTRLYAFSSQVHSYHFRTVASLKKLSVTAILANWINCVNLLSTAAIKNTESIWLRHLVWALVCDHYSKGQIFRPCSGRSRPRSCNFGLDPITAFDTNHCLLDEPYSAFSSKSGQNDLQLATFGADCADFWCMPTKIVCAKQVIHMANSASLVILKTANKC